MRAFPVQDFIPVDGNVESATVEGNQLTEFKTESVQIQASNSTTTVQEGAADNQIEVSMPLNASEGIPQQEPGTSKDERNPQQRQILKVVESQHF